MGRLRFVLFIALAAIFAACSDGFEDYSYSPGDVLTFSTDTVAFDTVVSTVRTPFAAFTIYNPSKKDLLISSITLENGDNFKINVDGRAGNSFSDIEILSKDSLYILVEAQPSENQSDIPAEIIDHIVFVTNGVKQSVVLQAVAQDAEIRDAIFVTVDSTLNRIKPYLIYDSLVVQAGATLTIPAGARLYMHANANIIVHGTLIVSGTAENPVIIRGDRFDQMVGIPYDRIPGQWGGIQFDADSYDNVIEHARIRNGSTGLFFAPSDPAFLKLSMHNTVVTNFKGMLTSANDCRIFFEQCELSNAKDGLVSLNGGYYSFIHCTLANYYFNGKAEYGWGNTKDATVFLSEDTQAEFNYSIIWGANGNSTSQMDNATIIHCMTEEDPKFRIIQSEDKNKAEFIYDFRLQDDSPALLPDGGYMGCYPQ
ncbi:MAG: hypothetical protein LBN93_06225 [Candidatus Symbiothrix sp.]|jgi:hypothetical protein|nr:hypothetical protein [Candidatus Symbiothrix sp.]